MLVTQNEIIKIEKATKMLSEKIYELKNYKKEKEKCQKEKII